MAGADSDSPLELLDRAQSALRAAVSQQRHYPAHEAFYRWGSALDDITYRLSRLCRLLDQQVSHYADQRILRDDEDADPAERIRQMSRLLTDLAQQLENANATARQYHNEASHIAVDVDLDEAET